MSFLKVSVFHGGEEEQSYMQRALDVTSVQNKIIKMTVVWVVAPWSVVEVYRRFRDFCCRHHRTTRKAEAYMGR
jgi:hypothetical protein